MSYLKSNSNIRLTLPTDSSYWVDICTDLTYGEIKGLGKDIESTEASDKYLSLVIKDWNLDDEDGKKLDLNIDNINLLKKDDVVAIIEAVSKEAEDESEKKDSSR